MVSLLIPHAQLSHLVLEEDLQLVGTFVVLSFRGVVDTAVRENARHVSDEKTFSHVVSNGGGRSRSLIVYHQPVNLLVLQSFAHSSQIHRIFNVLVIVRNVSCRDGLQERPACLVLANSVKH